MLQFEISANVRESEGKGAMREMRRNGKTPAIVYGPETESIALELDTRIATKLLLDIRRRSAVLTLDIKGGKAASRRHVIVKEIQSDPITDTLTHADFYEISLEKPVTLQVPLEYIGKAKGVDMGGDLVISRNVVTLKGKILDIPDVVQADISGLEPGASLTCNDLEIPANISLLDRLETVCVEVTPVGA
jgi:large subunit ribosomal protein L25